MRHSKRSHSEMFTTDEIKPGEVLQSVEDPGAGAIVLFLGTVRNQSEAGSVRRMTYEAYAPMAEKKLEEIERKIRQKWSVRKASIVHRVGTLGLKDISVAIAVSSAHRADAFEACRFAIENIKREVPIWKKERLVKGAEVWVEGRKIST